MAPPPAGNGGIGSDGTGSDGDGGGGGAGGYGVVVTGTGSLGSIAAGVTVVGGNGGAGGAGANVWFGGNGGSGGRGLQFTNAAGATFIVDGAIAGGTGGAGGASGFSGRVGQAGAGGAGIVGENLAITMGLLGTISGGLSGDGATRANAITFAGGANSLTFIRTTSGLTGNIGVTGSLDFVQSGNDVTVSNAITGSGSVSKSGTAMVTLSGINSYTGGTALNAGTLAISSDANLGAAVGGVTFNGGTLRTTAAITSARAVTLTGQGTIDTNGNTVTLNGVVGGGGGAFIKAGSGTLVLTNANTYSGGTTLNGGDVDVRNNTALGTGALTLNNGFSSLVTGANNLTLTNNVVVNAGLFQTGANTMTLTGMISGGGTYTKVGLGTLILTNANTNSGGIALVEGTIQVANNQALGTNAIAMANGTTLRAGAAGLTLNNQIGVVAASTATIDTQANAMTLGGVVSGPGALTKNGTGKLTLLGNNTIGGATTVNAGTLSVNGSLVSSSMTTVNAGGALGGSGTVGNTTINGGALAPGNSIGTLTVQGNLVFTAASSYMVEVDPSSSDRTNVTGTATLGDATVRATFANGSYVARQYTILNAAGGVTGTFASLVNTNLPANFNASLSYDANNAYLDLKLNFGIPSSLNGNQQSVGNALTNSFNTAGGIPLAFGALTAQQLTQVSGEAATGSQQATFNVMSQFLNAMLDPNAAGRGGNVFGQGGVSSYADEALAYASARKGRNASEREAYNAVYKAPPRVADVFNRWTVWAAGYGGTQTTTGSASVGSADTTARIYGMAAGADYRFSADTLVGFSLGGAGTNYGLANGLGKGSSDVFQAGVYGRHQFGAAYVAAALAYGWQDVTTDRTVLGVDRLRARFDAHALSGRLEGGYRFAWQSMGVTPYAAGQFTTFFLPGYAEQVVAGGNTFALSYTSKDVTASRSELGVRTDKSFALNDALLTLRGRAAWAHNFNTDRSVQAAFQTLPASGFVVNGATQARDAALVSAGAEMAWRNGFSLAANFDGEFSRNVESYAGKGTVRYRW